MRSFTFLIACLALVGTACQRTERGTSRPLVSSVTTTPAARLRETRWVLRQLAGQPVAAPTANAQEPFLRITNAGTAEGQGGCNHFRGALKPATDDGELQFGPIASSRMACPALESEQKFTQALGATRTYRISGDTLRLYADAGRTGTPLAQLVAVYLR
jgi:heat shock protein HslJ